MAVDTPARIVIVGAGPIGLEASLYARFLGYDVDILERGEAAQHVRQWGHVRLFSPFRSMSSPLGLAALAAQDPDYQPPAADAVLTGHEWRDRYLVPLSRTDLLEDNLHLGTEVLSIARCGFEKCDADSLEARSESLLRVVCRDNTGRERELLADVVIDASGVQSHPNWAGQGGGPAVGEVSLRDRITYEIPDLLGSDRDRYANQRVLLVGNECTSASSLMLLIELAGQSSETRVRWASMPCAPEVLSDEQAQFVKRARATAEAAECVEQYADTFIQEIRYDSTTGVWVIRFDGDHSGEGEFDQLIVNAGWRPDHELYRDLQVFLDGYSDRAAIPLGPQQFLGMTVEESATAAVDLIQAEPHFYVLGSKSRGRAPNFIVSEGLDQARRLFAMIGDRTTLDLYAGAHGLGTD